MATSSQTLAALESFLDQGLITDILFPVKSGKEATVYCCEGGTVAEGALVAAKVYHPAERRRFKNDAVYHEGRLVLDTRARRAVHKKTRFGAEAKFALWVDHEYEILRELFRAGADVPAPFARNDSAILMEYAGTVDAPAPLLQHARLAPAEASQLFQRILSNMEIMLRHHIVHGDLSAFNILYTPGTMTIIDFPQAVDARFNRNAYSLLEHDVSQVCRYFARYGVDADPDLLAVDLWTRYRFAEL